MDLSGEGVSDNCVSSTTPDDVDIDKLVNEISEWHDEFDEHLYEIIKFRSKCAALIEKLRELKSNNLKVDDDIRQQVSVISHAVQNSCLRDYLKSMVNLMYKLQSDLPTSFP